eukprot:gnl/TRDRNA2_/TRDRNA2_128673_c0_seq1.p1 gnl/TRDRNA2_/TRDRNA2_128673_c0~~gnl/TRDRNA2_/TRDRNA2_128673_c0_seq1.p1  ORF type:complete len:790 (-),score=73.33 gnl/TRDRNA2_/TRDRNA2_128673_c0_seq1:57-2237(-)
MASNYYAGLTSGYTISTKSHMDFVEVFSPDEHQLAGGPRYASTGLVDDSNIIYMIAGRNSTEVMNDVWSYATNRETRCGSSFFPLGTCSGTSCTVGPDGRATLGFFTVKKSVWRAPSASTVPCIDGATSLRTLWGTMRTESRACPCPLCLTAPGSEQGGSQDSLPTFMVNTSYVSAYTLVSAAESTHDLLCAEGKVANGSFTCVVDTAYAGKYQKPYPECISAPCTSPPAYSRASGFAYLDIAASTGGLNCSAISSTNSMESGGLCAMKCKAGYMSSNTTLQAGFLCSEGVFSEASPCVARTCAIQELEIAHGSLDCKNGSSLADICEVNCDRGYTGAYITATCVAQTDQPEAEVSFQLSTGTPSTACVRITCGTASASNGAFTWASGTSTWVLTCNQMYMPEASAGITAVCASDGRLMNAKADMPILPSCEPAPPCSPGPAFRDEESNCRASMSDGDTCTATCMPGKRAAGVFRCLSGSFVGISVCHDNSDFEYQIESRDLISSTIRLSFSGDLRTAGLSLSEELTKSLAAVFDVAIQNVVINLIVAVGGRRLAVSSRTGSVMYDISYMVVVPSGRYAPEILVRASDIASPGSAASDMFASTMLSSESFSSAWTGVELRIAPRIFTQELLSGEAGFVTPAPSFRSVDHSGHNAGSVRATGVDAPAYDADDGRFGREAMVAGTVGALAGCCLAIAAGTAVYWRSFHRKKLRPYSDPARWADLALQE